MHDPTHPEPWCVIWQPPNAGYVQMTSNMVNEREAKRQAEFLKERNFTIIAVVSQAKLVALVTES